jgi:hypothetical protein
VETPETLSFIHSATLRLRPSESHQVARVSPALSTLSVPWGGGDLGDGDGEAALPPEPELICWPSPQPTMQRVSAQMATGTTMSFLMQQG